MPNMSRAHIALDRAWTLIQEGKNEMALRDIHRAISDAISALHYGTDPGQHGVTTQQKREFAQKLLAEADGEV